VDQRTISPLMQAQEQPSDVAIGYLKPPSRFYLRQMLLFHVM